MSAKMIDTQKLLQELYKHIEYNDDGNQEINADLVIRAVEDMANDIVFCKDCDYSKLIDEKYSIYTCTHPQWIRKANKDGFEEVPLFHGLIEEDYCSYGERKKNGTRK